MYEDQTYENILDRSLARVASDVDKREGSVIMNAIAPVSAEHADVYIQLGNIVNNGYADTAVREFLILRCKERGIIPYEATKATLKGKFNMEIPIGSRFNLNELNYVATAFMESADGYFYYQGNYYYIFPEITATDNLANNLESEMVLMINAHGLTITDPARDTITTTAFMQTSDNSYAVTEDKQEEGTYTLGAVATEQITSDDSSDSSSSQTSRLTVISSESMINSQITDTYTTLENLDLFMNAVTANFDKTKNIAIKAKSLEVSNNTMQHAGIISILTIFGIPLVILIYGFMRWWKRRKV